MSVGFLIEARCCMRLDRNRNSTCQKTGTVSIPRWDASQDLVLQGELLKRRWVGIRYSSEEEGMLMPLMALLILAFGPLNWEFPWWMWCIALLHDGSVVTVRLADRRKK